MRSFRLTLRKRARKSRCRKDDCMTIESPIQASGRELRRKHKALKALMAAHPFFKGLEGEHLAALVDCAMQAEFASGQVIFREGQPANRFYVILQGAVALEARAP